MKTTHSKEGPTTELRKEHGLIMRMVEAAEREAESIRHGGTVNTERIKGFIDFFRNFADRCHHTKEEKYLFPVTWRFGDPEMHRVIDDLMNEHDIGRTMLAVIDYLVSQGGQNAEMIGERLQAYADMLRIHIGKENEIAFRRGDIYIPQNEARALQVGYERLEQMELGQGFHEKYHALAEELLAQEPKRSGTKE